jgi:hypothetical protein
VCLLKIGTINVIDEIDTSLTLGSGGGITCPGSGAGGGRISLSATNLAICGKLLANGGHSTVGSNCGAGSGGSITIIGEKITSESGCLAFVSAVGGVASGIGGSGGGGRVTILVNLFPSQLCQT